MAQQRTRKRRFQTIQGVPLRLMMMGTSRGNGIKGQGVYSLTATREGFERSVLSLKR